MTEDATEHEVPTRREYVKHGGAVVGGGLLPGCVGDGSSDSRRTTDGATATDSAGATDTEATETTAEDGSHSVEMAPVGEVTDDEELFDRQRVADIINGDV